MEMYFHYRNIEIYNVLNIVILRGVICLTVFTYCSIEITIFFSLQTLWSQFLSNLVLSTLKTSEYLPHVGGRGQYILQVPVNEYVYKFKECDTMQVLTVANSRPWKKTEIFLPALQIGWGDHRQIEMDHCCMLLILSWEVHLIRYYERTI